MISLLHSLRASHAFQSKKKINLISEYTPWCIFNTRLSVPIFTELFNCLHKKLRKYSQTHFCTRQNKINVKSIEHTKELMLHWNRENKKEAWTQPKNCSSWRLFYIHYLQFLKYRDSQLDTYFSSTHSHWSVLNFIDIFFLIFDLKISRQKLRNIWQWKIERESCFAIIFIP